MAVFTITIDAYDNLPPNQLGTKQVNLNHGQQYDITLNDFIVTVPPYQDPEGDAPSLVKITQLPIEGLLYLNGFVVTLNQEITVADINSNLLIYIANDLQDNSYNDIVKFDIADIGSGQYSGLTTGNLIFKVAASENLPPSEVGDGSKTIEYGETSVFTSAMFTTNTTPPYQDPEGDNPAALKILSLPALGILRYNGIPVVVNQIISMADIDLGLFTYTPDLADTDGDQQSFEFAVSDTGSGQFVE